MCLLPRLALFPFEAGIMIRTQLLALAALALMAGSPAVVSAQYPWGCFGSGYGYAGGLNFGSSYTYGTSFVAPPPFYALFPPVYYSGEIVRRPYGSSPFAYPSWFERGSYAAASAPVAAAAQPAPEPLLIQNPFVQARNAEAKGTKAGPQVVVNPFVKGGNGGAEYTATAAREIVNPFVAAR